MAEMCKNVFNHLAEHYSGIAENPIDEEFLIERILDAKVIHSEVINERRWWNDTFNVVRIGGMYIGYGGAETTGDNSPIDVGWELEPSSIVEVEPVQKTVTVYKVVSSSPHI